MATGLPETIGSFRIVSKLGQGGMGAVFRAVHGTLERPVALKILPAEFANNPEYVMRFLREARTVATLRHENVVQVYDAGEQGGQYYIAMELVEGCNLLKYAEDKKIVDEADGMNLLLQASRGLAAAHAKGLVHRDIKPENLLVGSDTVLRVVDFGLVMESTSTTQLTATGACLGTPMYMSPEQADGEVADLRTDVYSLGVTFYRVFTGQPPFMSPTVMNLLFKHKFETPPSPRSIRSDLSENTSNLLLHMMAKRREDRPQTAIALVEMIEGIKQGKTIPPPPSYVSPLPGNISGAGAPMSISGTGTTASAGSIEKTLLSGARPTPAPASPRKAIAVIAAIVLLLAGMGVYFATRAKPDAGSGQTVSGGTGGVKTDYLARGDEAFAAGKHQAALEFFRDGLIASPDDATLKDRIASTEKALRVDALLQAGDDLDAKGELDDAVVKFNEAIALDDTGAAKLRLERVKEKQNQNRNLDDAGKLEEREKLTKKASEEERAKRFAPAADLYSRAAALSEASVRNVLAEKAAECRRQDLLVKAMDAEERNDLAAAKNAYERALALKQDEMVQKNYDMVLKKMHDVETNADTDKAYNTAMREGDNALNKKDFATAKFQFGIALGLKPTSEDAQSRVAETKAREFLAKGDAIHDNSSVSIGYFNEAMKAWPPIAQEAQARIRAVQSTLPTISSVWKKVDPLVRAEKDDAAMAELAGALKNDSGNPELKMAKSALENLQSCSTIYAEMTRILEAAANRISDARDLEDDIRSREFRDAFTEMRKGFVERARKARPLFLNHEFDAVKTCLEAARKDAKQLYDSLVSAYDFYDGRADKAGEKVGINTPLGKLGMGGDSKKADKYRKISDGFKKLGSQAKALRE